MKKLMKVLPVMMLVVLAFTSVFAISADVGDLTQGQGGAATITAASGRAWATVVTIVQILAIGAIVFAGLRYMFASADQKADIKKSMSTLAIGAVLVFGATTVVKFISSATTEVIE